MYMYHNKHIHILLQMLRTCSEPDLSKLFKTLAKAETLQKSTELSASTGALDKAELDDEEEEEIVADENDGVEVSLFTRKQFCLLQNQLSLVSLQS